MTQAAYPAHIIEAHKQQLVEQHVCRMAGFPRRLVVSAKTMFRADTSLKSSPHLMAFATRPEPLSKAEAMQRMMERFG